MSLSRIGSLLVLLGVAALTALSTSAAHASGGLTGTMSGPSSVSAGSQFSYTIGAYDSTIYANGVSFTDFLDPHELFVSVSPAYLCSQTPAVGQSGLLSCNLGQPSIYTGQTQSVILTVETPSGTSVNLTNSVTFSDGVNNDVESVQTSINTAVELTGVSINAQPNQLFSGAVATFTDPACGSQSGYAVTIYWGDGTSSYETLPGYDCSNATISGSHTFANAGLYTVTVVVQGYTNPSDYASTSVSASVGVAPATSSSSTSNNTPWTPPLNYNGNAYDPCTDSSGCPYGPI